MPRNQTRIESDRKAAAQTMAARLAACEKYAWYIDHAFDFRKREITKQLDSARMSLATPIPADYPAEFLKYEEQNRASLQGLIDHLEWVQREFNDAHEALKAAGIK